jgi:hypothetical protein
VKWVAPIAVSLTVVLALPAQAVRQLDARTMTIRLVSTETYSKVFTDRPPINQASKGDVILVASTLRNAVAQFGRPKGAVVGEDTVVFTIHTRTEADVIVESNLPGGWLRGAGRVRFGPKQTFSVTGGRGRFAKARGTGESTALGPNSSRRLKLYRLRLP